METKFAPPPPETIKELYRIPEGTPGRTLRLSRDIRVDVVTEGPAYATKSKGVITEGLPTYKIERGGAVVSHRQNPHAQWPMPEDDLFLSKSDNIRKVPK